MIETRQLLNIKIKPLIPGKDNAHQLYQNNKTSASFRNRLNFLQERLKNFIEMRKQKNYFRICKQINNDSNKC